MVAPDGSSRLHSRTNHERFQTFEPVQSEDANLRNTIYAMVLCLLPACAHAEATMNVRVTLFGYADNDPPGTAIAHPVIHRGAAGKGTYDDPITFAANPQQFAPGTKIYVPYLKKYFLMEDDCATSIKTASYPTPLIDLWAGGTSRSDYAQLMATESAHTRELAQIIVDPAPAHPVDTKPIFVDRPRPNKKIASADYDRRGNSGQDRSSATRWPWLKGWLAGSR
jgi:hypothetical protein